MPKVNVQGFGVVDYPDNWTDDMISKDIEGMVGRVRQDVQQHPLPLPKPGDMIQQPSARAPMPAAQPSVLDRAAPPGQLPDASVSGVVKDFAKNAATSTGQGVYNIGKALVNVANPNPNSNTLNQVARLTAGGLQKLPFFPGEQEDEKYFDAAKSYLGNRYGSGEAMARTGFEDPFGMFMDVSAVLGGTGAALRGAGELGELAGVGRMGTLGEIAQTSLAAQSEAFKLGSSLLNPVEQALGMAKLKFNSPEAKARLDVNDKYNLGVGAQRLADPSFAKKAISGATNAADRYSAFGRTVAGNALTKSEEALPLAEQGVGRNLRTALTETAPEQFKGLRSAAFDPVDAVTQPHPALVPQGPVRLALPPAEPSPLAFQGERGMALNEGPFPQTQAQYGGAPPAASPQGGLADLDALREAQRQAGLSFTSNYPGEVAVLPDSPLQPPAVGDTRLGYQGIGRSAFADTGTPGTLGGVPDVKVTAPHAVHPRSVQTVMDALVPDRFKAPVPAAAEPPTFFPSSTVPPKVPATPPEYFSGTGQDLGAAAQPGRSPLDLKVATTQATVDAGHGLRGLADEIEALTNNAIGLEPGDVDKIRTFSGRLRNVPDAIPFDLAQQYLTDIGRFLSKNKNLLSGRADAIKAKAAGILSKGLSESAEQAGVGQQFQDARNLSREGAQAFSDPTIRKVRTTHNEDLPRMFSKGNPTERDAMNRVFKAAKMEDPQAVTDVDALMEISKMLEEARGANGIKPTGNLFQVASEAATGGGLAAGFAKTLAKNIDPLVGALAVPAADLLLGGGISKLSRTKLFQNLLRKGPQGKAAAASNTMWAIDKSKP